MQTGEPAPHPMLAMLKLLVNGLLIMRRQWARYNGCVRQDVAAGGSVAILLQTIGNMSPGGNAPGSSPGAPARWPSLSRPGTAWYRCPGAPACESRARRGARGG